MIKGKNNLKAIFTVFSVIKFIFVLEFKENDCNLRKTIKNEGKMIG
jgi:hypothetical protein